MHRDLKPANVKLTPDNDVKVLDFGLAKALADGARTIEDVPDYISMSLSPDKVYKCVNIIVLIGVYLVEMEVDVSAMVRIRDRDHDVLKELSDAAGESMADILARAIEEYRRKHFLVGLAEDFAAMRVRDAEWESELEEREAWDEALGDDLENE